MHLKNLCYDKQKLQPGCDRVSVVLTVCHNNFVKMVCDGRVFRFSSNKQPIACKEDFNKLRQINPSVILGFAGDRDRCRKILKVLSKYDVKKLDVCDTGKAVQEECLRMDEGILKTNFMIGGISHSGETGVIALDSSNHYQWDAHFPKYGESVFLF